MTAFPWMNEGRLLRPDIIARSIPSTNELIPVVGIGSWRTFNVINQASRLTNMQAVLAKFYELGGRVVDSSPMYGSSEAVIGKLAKNLSIENDLWVSTKIWTNGKQSGIEQINTSNKLLHHRVQVHHIHNLRDLAIHFASLKALKEKGELKYIGVTHYVNGMHNALEKAINQYPLDFIQVNYNIGNIHAANRLLSVAADKGVAVIVNRPFQEGALFNGMSSKPLPTWSSDYGIQHWAQFFLKYIISHPAVTCVIPATTQVNHVTQNMQAGTGLLPDTSARDKMLNYYQSIR